MVGSVSGTGRRALCSVARILMALLLLSTGYCYAQTAATGCILNNTLTSNDGLLLFVSDYWAPGNTFTATISGAYPLGSASSGCTDVTLSAWEWNDYPNDPGNFGPAPSYISLSNFHSVSADEEQFQVTVSNSAPVGQYIYLTLEPTYAIQAKVAPPWLLYWGVEIENPPPIALSRSCPIPSITSVTPSTWIAGGTYPIKVLGSGFVTSAAASENCPETQLAITAAQTGMVPTSDVTVVNSGEITATVAPESSDPVESAFLRVANGSVNIGPGIVAGFGQSGGHTLSSTFQAEAASPGGGSSYPAQINNLPPPIIERYGNVVSGKTTPVIVGQPIELTATTKTPIPEGLTLYSTSWSVTGFTVGGYDPNSNAVTGIKLTATPNPSPTAKAEAIKFYWLYPGTSNQTSQQDPPTEQKVKYRYCALQDGNQICSPTATATFQVSGADTAMIVIDSDEASIEKFYKCSSTGVRISPTEWAPWWGYGDMTGPDLTTCGSFTQSPVGGDNGNIGIMFMAVGQPNGKYVFAQLLDPDSYIETGNNKEQGCGPFYGIDHAYPYQGQLNRYTAADAPGTALDAGFSFEQRNFHAKMYVLWQPDQLVQTSTPSIPVPIGYVSWQFVSSISNKSALGGPNWNQPQLQAHGPVINQNGRNITYTSPADNSSFGYPVWDYTGNTCPALPN